MFPEPVVRPIFPKPAPRIKTDQSITHTARSPGLLPKPLMTPSAYGPGTNAGTIHTHRPASTPGNTGTPCLLTYTICPLSPCHPCMTPDASEMMTTNDHPIRRRINPCSGFLCFTVIASIRAKLFILKLNVFICLHMDWKRNSASE